MKSIRSLFALALTLVLLLAGCAGGQKPSTGSSQTGSSPDVALDSLLEQWGDDDDEDWMSTPEYTGTGSVVVDGLGTYDLAIQCNEIGLERGRDMWDMTIFDGPGTGPNGEPVHVWATWSKMELEVLSAPGSLERIDFYASGELAQHDRDRWSIDVDGPHISGQAWLYEIVPTGTGLEGEARFAVNCN